MPVRKLITCPESAHLEEIEYEDHPLGLLIVGCSQFKPSCAVTCARECAVRLDRRRRLTQQFEEMPTVDAAVGNVALIIPDADEIPVFDETCFEGDDEWTEPAAARPREDDTSNVLTFACQVSVGDVR